VRQEVIIRSCYGQELTRKWIKNEEATPSRYRYAAPGNRGSEYNNLTDDQIVSSGEISQQLLSLSLRQPPPNHLLRYLPFAGKLMAFGKLALIQSIDGSSWAHR